MKKEKTHNLLLFILIFLAILSIVLIKPLNNLDEIWNYNFARNIANGLVPYKEFNMLQMPLLPIIGFGTALAPIVIGLVKAYKT